MEESLYYQKDLSSKPNDNEIGTGTKPYPVSRYKHQDKERCLLLLIQSFYITCGTVRHFKQYRQRSLSVLTIRLSLNLLIDETGGFEPLQAEEKLN